MQRHLELCQEILQNEKLPHKSVSMEIFTFHISTFIILLEHLSELHKFM